MMTLSRRNFLSCVSAATLVNPICAHAAPDVGRILYDFGKGMSNFQNHAFDVVNRHLYTLQHSDKGTGGPAKISRFKMDSGVNPDPIDSIESSLVGHQTLDVEYIGGKHIKLWAAIGPKFSRGVIRFDYNASAAPSNVESYELFDPKIFAASHCTASISYDQRYLVARALSLKESSFRGKNCIAVFDLNELVTLGPGERWDVAKHLWPIENYPSERKYDPQAVVCDRDSVSVLYGPMPIELPNMIRVYKLNGELLREIPNLRIGLEKSRNLSEGTSNEFEGAKYLLLSNQSEPTLTVGMLQGGPIYYKRIWAFSA